MSQQVSDNMPFAESSEKETEEKNFLEELLKYLPATTVEIISRKNISSNKEVLDTWCDHVSRKKAIVKKKK